jgi:hypothetical protein
MPIRLLARGVIRPVVRRKIVRVQAGGIAGFVTHPTRGQPERPALASVGDGGAQLLNNRGHPRHQPDTVRPAL